MLTDIRELKAIAKNLAALVLDGTYSINEAILEVMPHEYSLSLEEKLFIRSEVERLTNLLIEEY
jgi:hypothetical protein